MLVDYLKDGISTDQHLYHQPQPFPGPKMWDEITKY